LVIDQPGSIAQLALARARQREVPAAYIPGLVMRRAADLYPGDAKTDWRGVYVIADTARTRRDQIRWLGIDDDLFVQLRVLNGLDRAADPWILLNVQIGIAMSPSYDPDHQVSYRHRFFR
jgi:hypothetical protein